MATDVKPITADEIQSLIAQTLPDAVVQVRDFTGGGDHYEAVVVSPAFVGKTQVARHRLVYGALQGAMDQRIHALALKTLTPEERQAEAQAADPLRIQKL
ncbi:MAG: BolA family protein [Candidatus Binatia bacterium]